MVFEQRSVLKEIETHCLLDLFEDQREIGEDGNSIAREGRAFSPGLLGRLTLTFDSVHFETDRGWSLELLVWVFL